MIQVTYVLIIITCLEHSAGGDNDVADALYLLSTT